MKKEYVIDVETNGLLYPEPGYDVADKIFCIVCNQVDSRTPVIFTCENDRHYNIEDFPAWLEANVSLAIAHNGIKFDFPMLEKFTGCSFKGIEVFDTLLVSQLNDYTRKATGGRHSLKAWGIALGEHKGDFTDFSEYSTEMLDYCIQDTVVNINVYEHLKKEIEFQLSKRPHYQGAIDVEHSMARYVAGQERDGWLFDFKTCGELIDELTNKMVEIENEIEPNLKPIERLIDKEEKQVKYTRDGRYHSATARMLTDFLQYTVLPEDALKANPPVEPGFTFQRKEIIPAGLGNQDSVRDYLEELGIKWTQWNYKKVNGQFIKMSPKMNDDDLDRVGHPHATMLKDYYTLRSRRSILQGFMSQANGDGRLRGQVRDLGAASHRHTHKVIANLPNANAFYGKEIRSLFICPEDKVIISADGAAYQLRLLAHYLKDEGYMDIILNGDAHQRHADAMGIDRATAKPVAFAILYGAGAGKVASIMGSSQKRGGEVRNNFINNIPNLSNLIDKAQRVAETNGWLPMPDGRKVYCTEPFKALNYLIQGTEACLMKRTIVRINEGFEDAGIEFKQLLMYHDECSWEIDPKDIEAAEHIIRTRFHSAPCEVGITIMEAGDVNVGKNYYEVH